MYWDRFSDSNKKNNGNTPWGSPNTFEWYGSQAGRIKNNDRTARNWDNLSTSWRARNPTPYTPQFEQRLTSNLVDTNQKQYDNTQRQLDSKFGASGLYGQPVHQSMARSVAGDNAANLAGTTTDLLNKIQIGRNEDYKDWYNAAQQRKAAERDWQMRLREADFNQAITLENQRMQSREINDKDNDAKRRFILSAITGGMGGGGGISGGSAVSSLPGLATMGAQGRGMLGGAQGAGGLGAQLRGLGTMGMTGLKTLGSGAVTAYGSLAGLI